MLGLTSTPEAPTAAPAAAPRTTGTVLHGPIVLAADGSELAGNAARVAATIAQHVGVPIQVLTVVDTRGVPIPPPLDVAIGLGDAVVGPAVHEEQASQLRTSLSATLDEVVDWPVRVALGAPAPRITQHAAQCTAGLVVVGLRHHGPLGRALQDETAIQVMRQATCPVLAVAPSLTALPRRIVVGVDFTRASTEAARVALGLLAPGGTVTLAYAPGVLVSTQEEGERRIHDLGVEAAFDALVRTLDAAPGVTLERARLDPTVPHPTAAHRLLTLAEETHADLIVLGSRRHGRVERWMLGSVTTDVARDGRISVLAVPPNE